MYECVLKCSLGSDFHYFLRKKKLSPPAMLDIHEKNTHPSCHVGGCEVGGGRHGIDHLKLYHFIDFVMGLTHYNTNTTTNTNTNANLHPSRLNTTAILIFHGATVVSRVVQAQVGQPQHLGMNVSQV